MSKAKKTKNVAMVTQMRLWYHGAVAKGTLLRDATLPERTVVLRRSMIKVEAREASGESQDFSARHDPDFQNLHRNKRAIALDLKQPAGMQVFHRLVADADIVVENFRPDVKHRLGIDYATLSADNPRLIYASNSGFCADGP